MDANERELVLREEVYAVVGSAIEVLNVRGHGLHEKMQLSPLVVCDPFNGLRIHNQFSLHHKVGNGFPRVAARSMTMLLLLPPLASIRVCWRLRRNSDDSGR